MNGPAWKRQRVGAPEISLIVAVLLATLLSSGPSAAQTVAITHGEVHPVSGPVISGGTVLMVDGVITAVGRDVPIPSGAEVVDAAGKVVTPGLFDSSTRLGVVEIGSYQGTSDGSSANDRMTAAFNVTGTAYLRLNLQRIRPANLPSGAPKPAATCIPL